MLSDIIANNIEVLQKWRTKIKVAIFILAIYFMVPTVTHHRLDSHESMVGMQVSTIKQITLEVPQEFSEERAPHQTIAIVIKEGDRRRPCISQWIRQLRLRTRAIKILTEQPGNAGYFVTIKVEDEGSPKVKVHPLRNLQPNSDVLCTAFGIVDPIVVFSPKDLFPSAVFENSLEITLDTSEDSRKKFLFLLHHFMNIRTHCLGTYYYIPLAHHTSIASCFLKKRAARQYSQDEKKYFFIRAEQCATFIILVIIVQVLSMRCTDNPFILVLSALLFYICPVFGLFFIRRRGTALHLLVFSVINFRMGYFLSILVLGIESVILLRENNLLPRI